MYFDEYGDRQNPTLVLLDGAADGFCKQYYFEDRLHLVVPHLHGEENEPLRIYEPDKAASEVVEIIGALNKGKVMLMGHSLGAELAVKLVCEHEDMFSKAVFIGAWVCSTQININRYAEMATYMNGAFRRRVMLRRLARYWGYNKEQTQFMNKYIDKVGDERALEWYKNRVELDSFKNYSKVKIPMLALCASRETLETKRSLMQLDRRNKHCRSAILKNTERDFVQVKSDELNPILEKFIFEEGE